MRRHRYPRYAPEGLERKLHPSGIQVAAEVFIPEKQGPLVSDPTATTSLDATPPATAPQMQLAAATAPGAPAPTAPGSPEPTSPGCPGDGTDPVLPGDPPISYPSTPSGPGLPALA